MAAPSAEDLSDLELFRDLSSEERTTVAGWFEVEEVSQGQRLTSQDASGYVFFVLRRGAAAVSVDGRPVRTLVPGDFFGEVSLLFGPAQTATVIATAPSVVLRMFGTNFRQLQQHFPRIAAVIEEAAVLRRPEVSPATD